LYPNKGKAKEKQELTTQNVRFTVPVVIWMCLGRLISLLMTDADKKKGKKKKKTQSKNM